MAITIKGSPDVFAPAFNPMYFYLDSDNKDKEGFKYIFDIYKTGTAELITSISPYPRPIDGYGVCDLSQIIKSQLSEDIQQIKGPRDTPPVYSCFDIEFGEEYIQSWNFTDNFFVTSGPFESFLGFTGTGDTQPYIVGDFILVEQTIGFEQPAFNGVFEVLSADSNNVIVSSQYVIGGISSTTVNPGVIYFSDKRRTIFPDLTGFTGSCVFNGAVGHQEFMDYDSTDYDTTVNSGATFLTNIPDGYTVRPDNTMRLNFYNSVIPTGATFLNVVTQYGVYDLQNENVLGTVNVIGAGSADITFTEPNYINNFGSFPIFKNICYPVLFIVDFGGQTLLQGNGTTPWNDISAFDEEFVQFQGENGEAFGGYIVDLPTSNSIVIDYPFSAITSTTGHALQQTRWYEVKIFDSDLGYVTETKRFNVDWTPAFQFGPNVELVFLDRMGSYAPVNFQLQSSRTMNIQRDTYKKVLGNLNAIDISDKWQYNSTDRGMTNINTSVMTELTLNSNWMNETDVAYAKELYSSPRVYIKETDGKLWPVVVKTNSFNIPTKYNKKLISISITIQYANDDIINNI